LPLFLQLRRFVLIVSADELLEQGIALSDLPEPRICGYSISTTPQESELSLGLKYAQRVLEAMVLEELDDKFCTDQCPWCLTELLCALANSILTVDSLIDRATQLGSDLCQNTARLKALKHRRLQFLKVCGGGHEAKGHTAPGGLANPHHFSARLHSNVS
jgi:hypothetical protein